MRKYWIFVLVFFYSSVLMFSQSFEDDVAQLKAFARRYPYVQIEYIFQVLQVNAMKVRTVALPPPIGNYRTSVYSTSSGEAYIADPLDFGYRGTRDEYCVYGFQCFQLHGHYLTIAFNFFTGLSPMMRKGDTLYIETKNLNVDNYVEHFLKLCDTPIPGIDF